MAPRKYRMDKRQEAVEETRRRIVDATVALHGEQGILGTSWEDIAKKADVALATVYRHFPSLDELVPACGQQVAGIMKPPTLEASRELFAAASSQADRIKLLVRELFEFYGRGRKFLDVAFQEAHQVPVLAGFVSAWEADREEIVKEALRPVGSNDVTTRMVVALTDFRVWRSFIDQEVPDGEAVEVLGASLIHLLAESQM
jgi:AcrR family transcriptional regulator